MIDISIESFKLLLNKINQIETKTFYLKKMDRFLVPSAYCWPAPTKDFSSQLFARLY